jgi:hypothetical protein
MICIYDESWLSGSEDGNLPSKRTLTALCHFSWSCLDSWRLWSICRETRTASSSLRIRCRRSSSVSLGDGWINLVRGSSWRVIARYLAYWKSLRVYLLMVEGGGQSSPRDDHKSNTCTGPKSYPKFRSVWTPAHLHSGRNRSRFLDLMGPGVR